NGTRSYCLYSSYDSQNNNTMLADAVTYHTPCTNLIIGEFGLDAKTSLPLKLATNYATYAQVRRLQVSGVDIVPAVIPWHYVDTAGAPDEYGLLDPTGAQQLMPLMGPLRPPVP